MLLVPFCSRGLVWDQEQPQKPIPREGTCPDNLHICIHLHTAGTNPFDSEEDFEQTHRYIEVSLPNLGVRILENLIV